MDHFQVVCLNSQRTVREVEAVDDEFFLGDVHESKCERWMIDVMIQGSPMTFKVDTGADVNVITHDHFKQMTDMPPLKRCAPRVTITSVGGALEVCGVFRGEMSYKDKVMMDDFYVVETAMSHNLLSRSASCALGVVQFVDGVVAHSDVFGATGLMKTSPIHIELADNAVPAAVTTARGVPLPMMKDVQEELKRMESSGIIQSVTEPTDWCAPMVPVKKPSGGVRICVDIKELNRSVKREVYPIPTFEQLSSQFAGSSQFSKLDASSGFFQMPLSEESKPLTTFLTPFGRKMFCRLPMGINLAPEVFQRKMEEMLRGLEGVICYMDDIVVHGNDVTHDQRLEAVLDRIRQSGLKLNRKKCELKQQQIKFLGSVVSKSGIQADPEKVAAIQQLDPPRNVKELKQQLGMINYLCKFVPGLQGVLKPMNDLLKKETAWQWTQAQQQALEKAKAMLQEAPVLAFYDSSRETVVSADASSYGIGGCLLQRHGDQLKPVAYASRLLTPTEQRYAMIEKELLGLTWACEKFHMYLFGLPEFAAHVDHKPLIPLVNSKPLTDAPIRCQRMLMRLMRYNVRTIYVPDSQHCVPDCLSRQPLRCVDAACLQMQQDVEDYVNGTFQSLPMTDRRLSEVKRAQQEDGEIQRAVEYTVSGWSP